MQVLCLLLGLAATSLAHLSNAGPHVRFVKRAQALQPVRTGLQSRPTASASRAVNSVPASSTAKPSRSGLSPSRTVTVSSTSRRGLSPSSRSSAPSSRPPSSSVSAPSSTCSIPAVSKPARSLSPSALAAYQASVFSQELQCGTATEAQAMKQIYGFDPQPSYALSEKTLYTMPAVLSQATWQARNMGAWSKMYIDSIYDADKVDDDGNPLGWFDQVLLSSQYAPLVEKCRVESVWANCGGEVHALLLGAQAPQKRFTNFELNQLLLIYNMAVMNDQFYVLTSSIGFSKTDGAVDLPNMISLLLPPHHDKPAGEGFEIFMNCVDILLAVLPEVGIVESIVSSSLKKDAEKVFEESVEKTEKLEEEAARLLATSNKIASGSIAGSNAATRAFGSALSNAIEKKFTTALDQLQSKLAGDIKFAKEASEKFKKSLESGLKKVKAFKTVIDKSIKIFDEAQEKNGDPAPSYGADISQIPAPQLAATVVHQLDDYKAKVKALADVYKSGSPYAYAGAMDYLMTGSFTKAIDDKLISGLQDKWNTFMAAYLFESIFGKGGKQVFLFKQQWNSRDECHGFVDDWSDDIPGITCLPPNLDLPHVDGLNDHNHPEYAYLFYAASPKIMSGYKYFYLVPPVTDKSNSFYGNLDGFNTVDGMPNLDAAGVDTNAFYWESWWTSYQAGSGALDSDADLWQLPSTDSPPDAGAVAHSFPVLDVNDGDFITRCNAFWTQLGRDSATECTGNQQNMWNYLMRIKLDQAGIATLDDIEKDTDSYFDDWDIER